MDNQLEVIKKILRTPIALRNPKMISLLMSLTKEIKFFKDLIADLGEKMHYRICEFISLDYREENSTLFSEGDQGDYFYILLSGKVKLLISKHSDNNESLTEIAQLTSGQSFGELSLIKDQPRTATVICMQSCYFMTLSKENYLRLLGKSFAKMLEDKINLLHSLALFNRWTKKSLEKLSYFFFPRTYKHNQVIYHKDQVAETAYIIVKGEVELTVVNQVDKSLPKELKVAIIGQKDIFGDEELLLNSNRKYTARCLSKVVSLFCIQKEDFLTKIDKESLQHLVRSNFLRNNLRQIRLKSVGNSKIDLNKSGNLRNKKSTGFNITYISLKKNIKPSPVRNLRISPMAMKNIEKKSLANLNSPTISIIRNSPITTRPKSVNVFINMSGFQPRNQLPSGTFLKLHNRLRRYIL